MDEAQGSTLERADDIGKSPEAIARRWKLELKLADKRESAWRNKVKDIYKTYCPENPAANSFNILWSNTETLRQSVYNSIPSPNVRRRYQDEDKLGKQVSDVLNRALVFSQDTYDFDGVIKGDVLAMLLPGRAVSRVRYVPDIRSIGGEDSATDDDSQESEAYEEIAWEQVITERVQWDDFRISAGKTWEEVCWIAFRHRFTREDCEEKFGEEIGKAIPLDSVDDDDVKKSKDTGDLFKTAEVWEIWDKDEKEVVFICPTYPKPCKTQEDPLKLSGFFPVPRPLYAIENDQSLVPASLYTQYEQQAKELNRISTRINKIIDALKVRGVYDSTLEEIGQLMKSGDNELIPAQNVTALLERGGLDKAIWMMPIDTAAMVLKELYAQRDASKQVIYEITGISDIMRSASDPNETFGAQKIKTQWGTQRLQRMQKEVQRYIRDLIRLKAEIIAEKFQIETLEQMTLLQLPHDAQLEQQKQVFIQQHQQAAMQAQQQGKPIPPFQLPPKPISWEDVKKAMESDAQRTYHIDIETDSTISASQDADMQGMRELLTGVTQFIQGVGPAVQQGAFPIEAVKEIVLAITRRARMGSAVEDALEKIQAPKPQQDPAAAKAQADAQAQQAQQQHEAQLEQMKAQLQDQQSQRELQYKAQADNQAAERSMQLEQWKQQQQAAQIQHQNDLEAQRELQHQELEAASEARQHEYESQREAMRLDFDKYKAELDYRKAIEVAEISAKSALNTAQASAATQAAKGEPVKDEEAEPEGPSISDVHGMLKQLIDSHSQPKTIERGPDGKAISVGGRQITRGPDGHITGVH